MCVADFPDAEFFGEARVFAKPLWVQRSSSQRVDRSFILSTTVCNSLCPETGRGERRRVADGEREHGGIVAVGGCACKCVVDPELRQSSRAGAFGVDGVGKLLPADIAGRALFIRPSSPLTQTGSPPGRLLWQNRGCYGWPPSGRGPMRLRRSCCP